MHARTPQPRYIIGKKLDLLVQTQTSFTARRTVFASVWDFLEGCAKPELCLLVGARRTGKTSLMIQALAMLGEKRQQAVFFPMARVGMGDEAQENVRIWAVLDAIERLMDEGKTYFFLDDVDRILDFESGAAILANDFAALGAKIVGTGLGLGSVKALIGRANILTTTTFSFDEWVRIHGQKADDPGVLDNFARNGGILGREDSRFGVASFGLGGGWWSNASVQALSWYNEGSVEAAIEHVLEESTKHVFENVLQKEFALSHLLHSLMYTSSKDAYDPREKIHTILKHYTRKKEDVSRSTLSKKNINSTVYKYIQDALIDLDGIVPFVVHTISDTGYLSSSKKNILVQHGLKYALAVRKLNTIIDNPDILSLFDKDRYTLISRLKNGIVDELVKEIVQIESQKAIKSKNLDEKIKVFSLVLPESEIDLVFLDTENKFISLFEIKNTDKIYPEIQARNLLSENTNSMVEKAFGNPTIVQRSLLLAIPKNTISTSKDGIVVEDIGYFLQKIWVNPLDMIFDTNNK